MTLYVLEYNDFDKTEVIGIFDNYDKANEIKTQNPYCRWNGYWEIETMELNCIY